MAIVSVNRKQRDTVNLLIILFEVHFLFYKDDGGVKNTDVDSNE